MAAIVNPAAGGGRARARWRAVEALLIEGGVTPYVRFTSGPGDATGLAREALSAGFSTIVAVGGDGTVHEVVNAFPRGTEALLGIVPAGTGMDFARNIGLPRRPRAAAARLLARHTRCIDVGRVEPSARRFINFAETGIGAAVVRREAEYSPSWPGRMSFFLAALETVLHEAPVRARIEVDGVLAYDGPLTSAVVANGKYFGGGMKIAPRASMDDGLFDILILGDFTRAELVAQIWKVYPGTHVRHRKVLWVRGRQVSIAADGPSLLDLDGELFGDGPVSCSIEPCSLRVIA